MYGSVPITILNKTYQVKIVYLLLLMIIVGALIRFNNLTGPGLWLDELFSMNGSDPSTTIKDVYEYSKGDQPPLLFFLLHGWLKIFGYSDFAGRALPCIIGLLGIPAIYFLGKEIKSEKLGLFAAFMTTINWFHADMSREIRFYPLVFLLSTLSFLFFLRSVKRERILDFVLYTLFTALLLNTHYFGMVVFVSQFILFIVILVLCKRSIRLIVGALLSGTVAGFSLYHFLPVIFKDLGMTSFHVAPLTWDFPIKFAWVYFKEIAAAIIFAFLIYLSGKDLYLKIKEKRVGIEDIVITGWFLIGFLIPLLYSILRVPLLTFKYSTITLPAIFIFIANGFTFVQSQKVKFWFITLLLLGATLNFIFFRPLHKPRRGEDWREVAMYFAKQSETAPPQKIFAQLAYFHIFYFKSLGYKQELPIDHRWIDFKDVVSKTDRLWLLTHPRYPDAGLVPEQQQLIDAEFEIRDEVKFKETKAVLYVRRRATP